MASLTEAAKTYFNPEEKNSGKERVLSEKVFSSFSVRVFSFFDKLQKNEERIDEVSKKIAALRSRLKPGEPTPVSDLGISEEDSKKGDGFFSNLLGDLLKWRLGISAFLKGLRYLRKFMPNWMKKLYSKFRRYYLKARKYFKNLASKFKKSIANIKSKLSSLKKSLQNIGKSFKNVISKIGQSIKNFGSKLTQSASKLKGAAKNLLSGLGKNFAKLPIKGVIGGLASGFVFGLAFQGLMEAAKLTGERRKRVKEGKMTKQDVQAIKREQRAGGSHAASDALGRKAPRVVDLIMKLTRREPPTYTFEGFGPNGKRRNEIVKGQKGNIITLVDGRKIDTVKQDFVREDAGSPEKQSSKAREPKWTEISKKDLARWDEQDKKEKERRKTTGATFTYKDKDGNEVTKYEVQPSPKEADLKLKEISPNVYESADGKTKIVYQGIIKNNTHVAVAG